MTSDLLLKARDKLTAAKTESKVLCLAAVKSYVVLEAFKVDNNVITHFSCSVVNCDDSCILFSEGVSLLVNVLVSYSLDLFFNFYTLIVTNFNLRLCDNCCLDLHAVSLGDICDLNVRSCNYLKSGLLNSVVDLLRIEDIYGCLKKYLFAVLSLDELSRSLALTEACDLDLVLLSLVSLLDTLLELFGRYLYLQLVLIGFNVVCSF